MAKERSRNFGFIVNMLLLFMSIVVVILFVELALWHTEYKAVLCTNIMMTTESKYYFKKDVDSIYDIAENFPPITFYFNDSFHKAWSNELNCFDDSYNNNDDYILLVGDSFTWGQVPLENNYGAVMESFLGCRVIKGGVAGYGTRQEFFKARNTISRIKKSPLLIIVGYFENDFLDDFNLKTETVRGQMAGFSVNDVRPLSDSEKKSLAKNWEEFGIFDTNAYNSFPRRIGWFIKKHSILYNMIINFFSPTVANEAMKNYSSVQTTLKPDVPDIVQQEAWKYHLESFVMLKKLADDVNAKLLIMFIPSKESVYHFLNQQNNPSWESRKKELKDFFTQNNIYYLDLNDTFEGYADQKSRGHLDSKHDLYWRYDLHWNANGNRLAGLSLASYVMDNSLIPISNKVMRHNEVISELKKFKKY